MSKTMDTTSPSAEKLEFTTISKADDGTISWRQLTKTEAEALLKEVEEENASAGDM